MIYTWYDELREFTIDDFEKLVRVTRVKKFAVKLLDNRFFELKPTKSPNIFIIKAESVEEVKEDGVYWKDKFDEINIEKFIDLLTTYINNMRYSSSMIRNEMLKKHIIDSVKVLMKINGYKD